MNPHVHSSLGVDVPVPVTEQAPTIAARKRDYTEQALATMVVAALPWAPVAAGAWIGGKFDSKGWGALAGFAVSFLVLRSAAKGMAGE